MTHYQKSRAEDVVPIQVFDVDPNIFYVLMIHPELSRVLRMFDVLEYCKFVR